MIQDWEDGYLSKDRAEHEMVKKNRKDYIVNLSIKHGVVTQFTSFIAVEKREKDEAAVVDDIPAVDDIMRAAVDVDILPYIGWQDDGKSSADDRQEQAMVSEAEIVFSYKFLMMEENSAAWRKFMSNFCVYKAPC